MPKISTADCKNFLTGFSSPFIGRVAAVTKLTPTDTWIRTRKYKDAQGEVCRDFANTGVPTVVILVERPSGLAVKRERPLGPWEKAYADHIEDNIEDEDTVDDFEEKILWAALQPEDFAFGFGDDGGGRYYFFQPVSVGPHGWDQHSNIDHLFPSGVVGGEVCESTYVFDQGDVTAQLIAGGFTHDKKLDNMSGS